MHKMAIQSLEKLELCDLNGTLILITIPSINRCICGSTLISIGLARFSSIFAPFRPFLVDKLLNCRV